MGFYSEESTRPATLAEIQEAYGFHSGLLSLDMEQNRGYINNYIYQQALSAVMYRNDVENGMIVKKKKVKETLSVNKRNNYADVMSTPDIPDMHVGDPAIHGG